MRFACDAPVGPSLLAACFGHLALFARACAPDPITDVEGATAGTARLVHVSPPDVNGPDQPSPPLFNMSLGQALEPSAREIILAELRPVSDCCLLVDDAGDGVLRATTDVKGWVSHAFDIATGVDNLLGALVDMVASVAAEPTGPTSPVRAYPLRYIPGSADTPHLAVDKSRTLLEFGRAPRMALWDGLRYSAGAVFLGRHQVP